MIDLTLAEVASAVGGTLDAADPGAVVSRVCIDSRQVRAGDLFVAVVGQTHDGHDHVVEALGRGAAAALVSRPVGAPSVVADGDTVQALGRIARAVLDRLTDCTVVAVTGSSGKTSTKDLIAQVLRDAGPTVSPPGSFNNEIGLPLTVLSADRTTRFLVLEMGMRGRGHIDYLCTIAPPDVAVVTNVGSAHIELLGSREAIAEAKAEIVAALRPDGTAVLNNDDPLVRAMEAPAPARVLSFGEAAGSAVRAVDVELDDQARPSFTLTATRGAGIDSVGVQLALHGRHQVSNSLAAAAVGLAVGVPLADIGRSLDRAVPASRWRMEVVRTAGGPVIVNDAYNANPESVEAALRALTAMAGPDRRSCALLGEMLEIGAGSAAAHAAIGTLVAELGVDRLVTVGEGARPVADAARAAGAANVAWVPGTDDAIRLLLTTSTPRDVILVKASRSIGLERVAVALVEAFGPDNGDS